MAALPTLLAGCGTPFQSREHVSLTAALPAQRLVLHNRIGDVIVHADPDVREIRAEVVKIGRASTKAAADNAVTEILVALAVKHDEPGTIVASVEHPASMASRGYEVSWRVTAPPELVVEIGAALGEVEVYGFTSPAVIETGLGDVDARGLPNGVQVRTSLGSIRAEAGGPIELRTGLGDVDVHVLGGRSGPVSVHSDLGTVHVRIPSNRSGRLVARTKLGSLRLRLDGISMRALRHRDRHFDAELGGQADPTMNLGTDLGDLVITTYPAEGSPQE